MQMAEIKAMQEDIEKLKEEMERLKILLEDTLLSDEEAVFVDEILQKIKRGDTDDFISLDELDEF